MKILSPTSYARCEYQINNERGREVLTSLLFVGKFHLGLVYFSSPSFTEIQPTNRIVRYWKRLTWRLDIHTHCERIHLPLTFWLRTLGSLINVAKQQCLWYKEALMSKSPRHWEINESIGGKSQLQATFITWRAFCWEPWKPWTPQNCEKRQWLFEGAWKF